MDVITLAKELALAVQKDDRYIYLDSARKTNDMDEELQKQIGKFNLARINLNTETNRTVKDTHRIDDLNEEINELYNEIMHNENMIAYNNAKADIEAMIKHIHAILTEAVNGGDPTKVQAATSSCGGSCTTCGSDCPSSS